VVLKVLERVANTSQQKQRIYSHAGLLPKAFVVDRESGKRVALKSQSSGKGIVFKLSDTARDSGKCVASL